MARANADIIRSIYEAFNRRDWDAVFSDQPDSELRLPPGPAESVHRGREAVQAYWEELLTAFAAASANPEELYEIGDQVVAVVKTRARPAAGSVEIEVRNGHVWTLRDGKVVSMELFRAPEEALEAAGLLRSPDGADRGRA